MANNNQVPVSTSSNEALTEKDQPLSQHPGTKALPDAQLKQGQMLTMWQGPLPPPAVLSEYDRIEPGFSGRIVVMAEKEQNHRHETEKTSVGAQAFYVKLLAVSDFMSRMFGQLFLVATFAVSLYFAFNQEIKLAAIFFSPFIVVALAKLAGGNKDKSQ